MAGAGGPKPLRWRGAAKADFMAFPLTVQREMGYALYLAQMGERHRRMAKTLKGFDGGTIVALKESAAGSAFRAVYTVRFADAVYVLHAFQKKSRKSIATPISEIETVKRRLKELIQEREGRW